MLIAATLPTQEARVRALGSRPPDDLDVARDWIADGSFVLHCGNAYSMDSEGEVTSS